jgi:hypothetical protein
LYAWLTFDWWYGALEPWRWREQFRLMTGVGERRQYRRLVLSE